jgi:ABC-2 type transport system permease protein
MNERISNLGFGLAWLVGVLLLGRYLPHAKLAQRASSSILGAKPTTGAWILMAVLILGGIALLFTVGMSLHRKIRDREKSVQDVLIDNLSMGLIWSIVTIASADLLLIYCAGGKTKTLRAFIFNLAKGQFESKVLLMVLGIVGLIVFILMSSRTIWTLFAKEFRLYFTTPIVYAIMMLFTMLAGYFFYGWFSTFQQYSLRAMSMRMPTQLNLNDFVFMRTFNVLGVILLFMVPLLTMRLLSEEKKNKTYELLMTAPITSFEIVVSKYLSSFAVLASLLSLTLLYPVLISWVAPQSFDWGHVFTGYLGLLFLAGSFAAIGLFCSSLTENQIIAAVVAFGVLLLLWVIEWASFGMKDGWARETVAYLSILTHLKGFIKGVVELKDVVYYLSLIVFANFLAHRAIESQRWR